MGFPLAQTGRVISPTRPVSLLSRRAAPRGAIRTLMRAKPLSTMRDIDLPNI
ncbi:MAG: hypothetical protein Tsb0010_01190 [Parvularculaceae bacterium]